MNEALALIDKMIEEHKQIIGKFRSLEQVANDAQALFALDRAKEGFMPGRFDQRQGLLKLEESLEIIDQRVQAHFNREETGLLTVFEKHGDQMLVSALQSLLAEHAEIRKRLAHSKKHVAELMVGELSRHVWDASAHDVRAHISHTWRLFQSHAQSEQKLFQTLRDQLLGK